MDNRYVKSKNDVPNTRRRRKSLLSNVRLLEQQTKEYKENFVPLSKKIEEDEREQIRHRMQDHFIFSGLNDEQLNSIFEHLQYCMTMKDQMIFKQNDDGHYFFIIHKGEVEIIVDNVPVRVMGPYESFGDFALLYNAPRSGSARCLIDTFMWTIERSLFRGLLNSLKTKEFNQNAELLKQVSVFNQLKDAQLIQLGKEMILERYRSGQVIVKQGEDALAFFLIKSGRVNIKRNEKLLATFTEGAYFGENAFCQKIAKRNASVIAETQVECYSISRSSLFEILGGEIATVISKNQLRDVLSKHQYLKNLTNEQLEYLMQNLKTVMFEEQSVIFNKNTCYDKLVIVLQGFIINSKFKDVNIIGVTELLDGKTGYEFSDDIVISAHSKVCEISYQSFISLFGSLATLLERNERFKSYMVKTTDEKNYEVDFESVNLIDVLGEGGYGTVYLVEHEGKLLAMKAIHKSNVSTLVEIKLLNTEKEIMKLVRFPLIVELEFSFKLNNFIFFFSEYIEGMKFNEAIIEMDLLSPSQSQFYVVQIVLMLEYLHGLSIIYRDLKPENVMIQKNGYLKLLDLGASKLFDRKSDYNGDMSRTFTVAGTPHYMAPEVISGGGYGYSVDYWSLGIILYELLIGYVPFGNDSEDIYEIYGSILRQQIEIPDWFDDEKSIDLIKKLLNKNCEARNVFSKFGLKIHPWFEGVDWLGFLEGKCGATFLPNVPEMPHLGKEVSLAHLDSVLEHKFAKEGFKTFNKLSIEIDIIWDNLN